MHAPWPFQQHENCKCTVNTISRTTLSYLNLRHGKNTSIESPESIPQTAFFYQLDPTVCYLKWLWDTGSHLFLLALVFWVSRQSFAFHLYCPFQVCWFNFRNLEQPVDAQSSAWWVLKFSLKPSSLSIKKGIQGARLACSGEWFNRVLCNNLWTIILASIIYNFR